MNRTYRFALAATLAASFTTASLAAQSGYETFRNGKSIYGVPTAQAEATKRVDVKGASYINVACGDTVTFVDGDQQFTWKFDVASHRVVELAKIAPAQFAGGSLKVYVARNDMERSR